MTLLQDGSVKLIWKCANPTGSTGTIYQVYRKLGTAADFQFVGGVGIKEFQDTTIPAGTMGVVYQITAVRSTSIGEPAQFNDIRPFRGFGAHFLNLGVASGHVGIDLAFVFEIEGNCLVNERQ